jgi:hypothetical protein
MTIPARYDELQPPQDAPQYRSRVVRVMSPADVRDFAFGAFDLADHDLYTFKHSDLRWLSGQIARTPSKNPSLHQPSASSDLDTLTAAYLFTDASVQFDLVSSMPTLATENVTMRTVVFRPSDTVPNFSFFRLRKPVALTIIDIIGVAWFGYFSYSVMNVYAAAAGVLSFLAVRETANMALRGMLRRERMGKPIWNSRRSPISASR